jgi:DUF1009 family protein
MTQHTPERLALIAGNGAYPQLLAESARKQGVKHIFAVAFRKETHPALEQCVDEIRWIRLGQLENMIEALKESKATHAVMAGQITPTHLFTVRLDARMVALLRGLKVKNAETIFSAVGDELRKAGIELLPASAFMESHMAEEGVLSQRKPSEQEENDIELGIRLAKTTSGLDIGQTVVVKQGTILAIEAFEGTNEAIARAARLGGAGFVVVKVAKIGHDMRFDIPVIGLHTMRLLKKMRAAVLAIEAGRAILLERDKVIKAADAIGLCLVAVKLKDP